MWILLQFAFEGILQEVSEFLIIRTFFVSFRHPYFNSETFECVPVGFLHEPDTSDIFFNAWDVSCGYTKHKGLPSSLEYGWFSDTWNLDSELTAIFVLFVLPLWVDASFENHNCGHLVEGVLALLEPDKKLIKSVAKTYTLNWLLSLSYKTLLN